MIQTAGGSSGSNGDSPSLSDTIVDWQRSSTELRKSMDELFETLQEASFDAHSEQVAENNRG